MPADPRAGSTAPSISQIITSQDHWYVNYTAGVASNHNDHLVIAWAVLTDNKTLVPMITSPDNQRDVVMADQVSPDYQIFNPYSQCQTCVRPEPSP
jgi:hypothetical protein